MTRKKSGIRRRIPPDLLRRMAGLVSAEDRDEMAIPSYLHPNPLLRWMAWRRIDAIATLFRASAVGADAGGITRRVMDYGCGTGVLFDEISALADEVVGIDLVLEPARLLIEEWDFRKVRLMDPEQAGREISANSIDIIIAAEVLEHIDPIEDTLAFFRECLSATGQLLVSVPTENALYRLGRRIAGFEDHYHESNAATIHARILASGFRNSSLEKIPAPGPFSIYWVAGYQPA